MSNLAIPSRIDIAAARKVIAPQKGSRQLAEYPFSKSRGVCRSRELNSGKLRAYTRERRAYSAELPTRSCKFLIVYRRFEILISRRSRARKHARSLSTSRDLFAGSPRDAALLILSSLSQRAARCQLSKRNARKNSTRC